ncbi:MAG: hypothetical protein KAJ51_12940 [Thermoplasmata archaeon]|nr:hypothetical protein [Thermoplasmata archaeon]
MKYLYTLIKLMLKEEYRFHTSFLAKYNFLGFPIMIMVFTFILAIFTPQLLKELSLNEIYFSLHSSLFLYGLSMGAFAFLGREYLERRFGQVNFMVSAPILLPIKFKTAFFAFFFHDVIFYILVTIIPLTCGLLLSIPFSGILVTSVLFLSILLILSFLLGISFSFFMSAVYMKNQKIFIGIVIVIIILLLGGFQFRWLDYGIIFPTLKFQLTRYWQYLAHGVVLIISFMVFASYLIDERFETPSKHYKTELIKRRQQFQVMGSYSILTAKELIDLVRSRTLTKIMFSFAVPLVFITFISWFFRVGLEIPIEFNIIFYGGMVGFFGLLIYSWQNNTDVIEFYQVLPITVPKVIKSKIIVFALITTGMSTSFVVVMAFIHNELTLLGWALLVMFITSFYIVTVVAYLTGLRTNTYLFNVTVLVKFVILVSLPLFCITILSFTLYSNYLISIFSILFICLILCAGTYVLFRGIEKKWAHEEFTF